MKKFGTKQVMPLLIIALCAIFIQNGMSKFGFWDSSKGPTAAFVPVIVCTMMIALCVMLSYIPSVPLFGGAKLTWGFLGRSVCAMVCGPVLAAVFGVAEDLLSLVLGVK